MSTWDVIGKIYDCVDDAGPQGVRATMQAICREIDRLKARIAELEKEKNK